jgi:outer membrane lipoprotein-sorting protein
MPKPTSPPHDARRVLRALAMGGFVASFVVACGGGAPAASTGPGGGGGSPAASTGSGGGTDGGPADIGEPYDKAIVKAAADKLAATDSYLYEMRIIQQRSSDVRTQNVHGVVRTKPVKARTVSYESGGDTIVLMFVDGKDFADYGNGLAPVGPDQGTREESDQLAVGAMFASSFGGYANHFVVKAKETVHGVATVHLVLDDKTLADRRAEMGKGYEGWLAELWLAEADGRLVKATWGGPVVTKPWSQLEPLYSLDVTDVGCECPVTAPG